MLRRQSLSFLTSRFFFVYDCLRARRLSGLIGATGCLNPWNLHLQHSVCHLRSKLVELQVPRQREQAFEDAISALRRVIFRIFTDSSEAARAAHNERAVDHLA